MKTVRILLLAVMLLPFLSKAQTELPQKPHKHIAHSLKAHAKNDSLVRGVSFSVFERSVPDFSDSTKRSLAKTAWKLWKNERWSELEQFFSANNLNGGWPPKPGCFIIKNYHTEIWIIS
jgi:hypothetical protein